MASAKYPVRGTVAAEPGPIDLDWSATALLIIDMQRDFMEPGGSARPSAMMEVMGGGSILAGLVLGAIGVFVIERDFMKASAFAFAGAAMTYFGFMHGEA